MTLIEMLSEFRILKAPETKVIICTMSCIAHKINIVYKNFCIIYTYTQMHAHLLSQKPVYFTCN